jgi:hypothetical protein
VTYPKELLLKSSGLTHSATQQPKKHSTAESLEFAEKDILAFLGVLCDLCGSKFFLRCCVVKHSRPELEGDCTAPQLSSPPRRMTVQYDCNVAVPPMSSDLKPRSHRGEAGLHLHFEPEVLADDLHSDVIGHHLSRNRVDAFFVCHADYPPQ